MRLDRFDLNLLVAFDVLVEERNVTRAAKRLNLTQSAMSAALRRLRDAFADDILVQHGKKMIPTAAALSLAPEIAAMVGDLRALIARGLTFNPAESQRSFRIVASDYVTTVLIGPLVQHLQRIAPHIRLEITLPRNDIQARLEDGDIDLIISPDRFLGGPHPRVTLFEERYVVVGWSGNPLLQKGLTEDVYHQAGHVAVSVSRDGTFIDNHLRDHGDRRRIEIVCAAFNQVAWLLPGTTRLALMHERLATVMAKALPLRIMQPPMALPVMCEMMQYHEARGADPGLSWLRHQLVDAAQSAD
ncbi:LysR family transcriptional regulator [Sphingobium sp. YR768]|uniref:LysR family transcriptional regulator n=1 Tax=Sphingobium sp. YR768 TaxID=1884365 RepID=UPI0008AB96C9|nr:LysR family transcriptional regulator [Sphingobium sp. YR768]SES11337.1 DNA-binding transcriptional regulator, LysR family [Sphingobium sp. YR768]